MYLIMFTKHYVYMHVPGFWRHHMYRTNNTITAFCAQLR